MGVDIDIINAYFPNLSEEQVSQFEMLGDLYKDWNARINVISRRDIDKLYLHHVLHSLSIAQFISFKPGTKVLDIGTGGGFPGIPLAILFPNASFVLVDGKAKKIKVVNEIVKACGLENCMAVHKRAEEMKIKFDFIVARAVAKASSIIQWSEKLLSHKQINTIPNGLLLLKGGDLKEELAALGKGPYVDLVPISEYFEEDYFKEKYIIYIQP